MSELLPCPFCGGEAELTGFNAPEYWVWCPTCKASADAHTGKQSAIDAWNTRYPADLDAIPMTDENMAAHGWVRERTCHNTHENRWFKCSACGYGFTDLYADDEHDIDEQPNYCPNCGAKVVKE